MIIFLHPCIFQHFCFTTSILQSKNPLDRKNYTFFTFKHMKIRNWPIFIFVVLYHIAIIALIPTAIAVFSWGAFGSSL